jgi:hypothetical protein
MKGTVFLPGLPEGFWSNRLAGDVTTRLLALASAFYIRSLFHGKYLCRELLLRCY